MKLEDVKALPDSDLAMFIAAGLEEQKARAEKRKLEAIAKIKEIAGSVGVSLTINGMRGRPAKAKTSASEARRPVHENTSPDTPVKKENGGGR